MKLGNVLAIILGSLMMHSPLTHAAVTINVTEVGGDVVASATGSFNYSGLTFVGNTTSTGSMVGGSAAAGRDGLLYLGPSGETIKLYRIDTAIAFSTGSGYLASATDGINIGIFSASPDDSDFILVLNSYASGSPIAASATWSSHSFASLGLIPGTYVVTWGSGETADSLTLNIGAAPPGTYTVGGDVTGLAGSGLVLQNNAGDDLAMSADGSFTFATALVDLSSYAVTVLTQPTSPNQTCSVSNDTGTLAGANVTDVTVTCVTDEVPTYTVGGNVTGLAGSGLVLQNNADDDLAVSADGSFTFATALVDLSSYAVTVLTQPTSPNQTCSVSNDTGTLAGANVTDVTVTCVTEAPPPAVIPNVPIPTLSLWGLVAMFLMVLGVGGMVVRRKTRN